jgi:hypothetical protein
MGVTVQAVGAREHDDLNEAFAVMDREPPDAILMSNGSDSLTVPNRKRVFEYAAAHRLPAIYEYAGKVLVVAARPYKIYAVRRIAKLWTKKFLDWGTKPFQLGLLARIAGSPAGL